ncbi:response regulator transcription factor [Umezawaea sp. Da 62-37]|uniref:helix-turn-helix transcriptional regulator n=1 Tax=Umezawaea sp. Da 62-37 TaxID=3075927 RepID=UPI0028F7279B|nr:response regulator transcription factor [Umezawaea sp. Da 62-37]WNV87944.1 response regulator transcription factor [Umezawaea sp. Da 62-37]
MSRIPVVVRGTDQMLQMGVIAALRFQTEIQLLESQDFPEDGVSIVIGDALDEDLLKVLRELRAEGCRRSVLVVQSLDDTEMMEAIELGVSVLVWRSQATSTRLTNAVEKAAAGHPELPPDLLARFLSHMARVQREGVGVTANASGLLNREVAVLRLVADGMDTKEIANYLSYSERTIKNILHDVTNRFHLRNRSHAVAFAMREGRL